MTPAASLPGTCAVAFKEWAGVCAALAEGRQSIILRKGGIAEDAGVFTPEHPVFWLYPTHLHEGQQGLKPDAPVLHATPGAHNQVPIRTLAAVESVDFVQDTGILPALDAFHVWTSDTVFKRFHYRTPGLWVLSLRVYTTAEPVRLRVTAEHTGCKTWVPLETPLPTFGLSAVLDDAEATHRRDRLAAVLHATR